MSAKRGGNPVTLGFNSVLRKPPCELPIVFPFLVFFVVTPRGAEQGPRGETRGEQSEKTGHWECPSNRACWDRWGTG